MKYHSFDFLVRFVTTTIWRRKHYPSTAEMAVAHKKLVLDAMSDFPDSPCYPRAQR
jgi:hypothetical protein